MIRRAKKIFAVLSVAVVALFAQVSIATAAVGPTLDLDTVAASSTAPGSTLIYYVRITNVGDETTTGSFQFQADLPDGVTLVSKPVRFNWSCVAAAGDPGASCEFVRQLDAGAERTTSILRIITQVDPDVSGLTAAHFSTSGGGAPDATSAAVVDVSSAVPEFGISGFDSRVSADTIGTPYTQAGGHPFDAWTSVFFNTFTNTAPGGGDIWPVESARDVVVDLPPGFVGNPLVSGARCTLSQLAHSEGIAAKPLCPASSQVGGVKIFVGGADATNLPALPNPLPVFNLVPPPGTPARFGFNIGGTVVTLDGRIRSADDYGVTVQGTQIPQGLAISGSSVQFWGVPGSPAHDLDRACPGKQTPAVSGEVCEATDPEAAFFRLPTSCPESPETEGLPITVRADSWLHPDDIDQTSILSHDPPGYPFPESEWGGEQGTTSCDEVPFEPEVSVKPTTNQAASPTGLEVDLKIPQEALLDPDAISQSDLRDAEVTLPQGMTVNPSSADGLGGCTTDQIGLIGTGFPMPNPIHFDESAPACPDSSKIGTVTIDTPLLEDPLEGSVYLAAQKDNPFDSLLALYIVASGEGVQVKLPGEVEVAPDGTLTSTFSNQPQLPFSHLHLELKSGPRAPLTTPATCGTHSSSATLTPWSGNEDAELQSSFEIVSGPSGGPCPSGAFDPSLSAGTTNPVAGAFSPFTLRLTRPDGSEALKGISLTLPPGLLAYLKGIPYCSDAAIAAIPTGAASLGLGAAQLASPACPAGSLVGTVTAGAGAGPTPFFVRTGRAYWAGPYKGAPVSLVVIAPALAGPFDLGNVVVRTGFEVDPATAQITAVSDPLPTALQGIPLNLRDVRVDLDRPDYVINPTSCDPMAFKAHLTGAAGGVAERSERFQVANCSDLGYKPKLLLRLKGSTKRAGHPKLIASFKARPGDANTARAQVTLPRSAFLDQSHIGTVCTRVQFAAQQCPEKSVYGRAYATSPILDYPLYGNVYLRSSSNELPDLVVALRGPDSQPIEVDLAGRTDSVKGALRNTFDVVPDAPVSDFRLELFGGKRGLVENSRNLCAHPYRLNIELDGQNGKIADSRPLLKADCGRKGKRKGGGKGDYRR